MKINISNLLYERLIAFLKSGPAPCILTINGLLNIEIKELNKKRVCFSQSLDFDDSEYDGTHFKTWLQAEGDETKVIEELNQLTDEMLLQLKKEDTIYLQDFGIIFADLEEGMAIKNPVTGEDINIPAKVHYIFYCDPKLETKCNVSFAPRQPRGNSEKLHLAMDKWFSNK